MAGVNKVILIGNLGADPEKRSTASGQPVCNFRIATSDTWNDREGQRQERTEWHRIVVWGRQADLCAQYLRRGRRVYVEGRLQTREWNDREGVKHYTTEIVAQTVQFLDGRGDSPMAGAHDSGMAPAASNPMGQQGGGHQGNQGNQFDYAPAIGHSAPLSDDDVPF